MTMANPLRFTSLADAEAELAALEKAESPTLAGPWSLAKVLDHCAASIEYSLSGYPRNKPALVRATIGPLVLGHFRRKGFLSHDRSADIPGDAAPPDADVPRALARLRRAIADFQASSGDLAPHFVYGKTSKAAYDHVHAMHVADHLSAIDYPR